VPVDQLLQVPLVQRHAVRAARLLPARARASAQGQGPVKKGGGFAKMAVLTS